MAIKSADRVLQIFEVIGLKREGITHGELAKTLNIPKGSLSLLLSNMTNGEYLTYDRFSRLYKLGPKLLILTGRYLSNLDIVRIGRPHIHNLVAEINEDAELAVLKDNEILFLHKEECSKPLKYIIDIGERAPTYATACGKAILAYLPENELSKLLSITELIAFTNNTITHFDALRQELEIVRTKGLAYGRQEYQNGISAIAAPVFNFCGNVVGSVTVTMPSIRFNAVHNSFIEPRLLTTVRSISKALGFDWDMRGEGSHGDLRSSNPI